MPNVRFLMGRTFNRIKHFVLPIRSFPFLRFVPHGSSVFYDVQRIAGTRDVGPLFDVGANEGQTA